MTNEEWRQRVRELGDMALELDAGPDRDSLIARLCGEDTELKARVTHYVNGADDPLFDAIGPPEAGAPKTGEQVGRWTLEQKIGEGGLGVVYRASRSDGTVRQRGAIKFLRGTFHGSDLETRFRDERQILANLSHPYIVGLIDGGVTEDGQPYLVMQLVENGEPLDTYCRKHQCSMNQRLVLFQKICEAVSYAHKNLVVHRDLKPGNILVTPDGTPHLLDFGVAKILDPVHRAGSEAAHSSHVLLGTERYFSPEQARMETLDQSTDIYSLGLILYELLTGTDPYDFENRVKETIQEIVCQVYPELPSRAVKRRTSRSVSPPESTPAQVNSIARPADLTGDIDAILIHALRKERAQRYPSVEDFSADIQRHLDHVPVKARLNTVSYRVSRFVRRNRGRVIVASAVGALALGLVTLVLIQERKSIEEATAEKVRSLANQSSAMLSVDPLRALQLAVEAVESTFDKNHYALPVAENALHQALLRSHRRWELPGAKAGNGMALSPDGKIFAAAGGSSIEIWDVEAKRRARVIEAREAISTVAFNADGTRLVSGGADGTATVWDLKSGQEVRTFNRYPGGAATGGMQVSHREPGVLGQANPRPGPVTTAVFSPDGMLLAIVADDAIRVWDVESGRPMLSLGAILWPPRGGGSQTLFVAQSADGPLNPAFPGPPGPEVALSWDASASGPGRRILIAGIESRGAEKWNVDTGLRTFQIVADTGGMSVKNSGANSRGIRMIWNRDSSIFSTIEGNVITLWESRTGAARGARTWTAGDGTQFLEVSTWTSSAPVESVAFGGNHDERLTVLWTDRSVKSFDFRANTELFSVRAERPDGRWLAYLVRKPSGVAVNAEGTRLATMTLDGGVTVWETSRESEGIHLPSPIDAAARLAVSPDGSRITTVLPDMGRVAIWDANTGRRLNTLGPEDARSVAVGFNRDGTRVVSMEMDGHATVTDPITGDGILVDLRDDTFPWSLPFRPSSSTIAFNRDATRVIIVDHEGLHGLWNPETGERLARYGFENPALGGGAWNSELPVFTRDGSRVATAANDVASILNPVDGKRILSVSAAAAITSLAFSPDGKILGIGQVDGKISLVDANSGRILLTVLAARSAVESLAFSPTGDRLAVGGADGHVKILEASSGKELLDLSPAPRFMRQPSDTEPPPDSVRSLTFIPNGRHLIIGSDSGVRVVTLDTGELLRMAHARLAGAK